MITMAPMSEKTTTITMARPDSAKLVNDESISAETRRR
jgi:hypothetical protein